MPRRFKEARLMNNLKAIEAAEKLGVAYAAKSYTSFILTALVPEPRHG